MDDAEINARELEYAQRALKTIKRALGWEKVYELIKDRVDASEIQWEEYLDHPEHEMVPNQDEFAVTGMSAEYFLSFIQEKLPDPEFGWYMHPEHYVNEIIDTPFRGHEAGGKRLIIEPWGDFMGVGLIDLAEQEYPKYGQEDTNYPYTFGGSARTVDGRVKGTVYYLLKNTEDGFIMSSRGAFPSQMRNDPRYTFLESYQAHLRHEWYKVIRLAHESLAESTQ